MKELLEYILTNILEDENVKVEEVDENGILVLKIYAPQEQIGRSIGKGGKTINALKNILKIKAIKEDKKIDVQIFPNEE